MSKNKKIIKWSLITLTAVIVGLVSFGAWFVSLIPIESNATLTQTKPEQIPYLATDAPNFRGKILTVVTSTASIGESGKTTGYELTELSRAYYVFQANGFEVDIASPLGGNPPRVIDDEDMGSFDYAFLNDEVAQRKATQTISIDNVKADDYEAIYFVGGKGAMFDFPDNKKIQALVADYDKKEKVIGAVCHGPAALVGARGQDGASLLANRRICSFTNEEELFLIPEAAEIFPFLLQDKLSEAGAEFVQGEMYLENVVKDGNIITGQNPWSTWKLAEEMILRLGYEPKQRPLTPEEITINVLMAYKANGFQGGKARIAQVYTNDKESMSKTLLAMHGIVAAMQFRIGKSINLIRLLSYADKLAPN